MAGFRNQIVEVLSKASGLSEEKVHSLIEIPPDPSLGDYAFPCFMLAKERKKNPSEIAKTISSRIKAGGTISKVETKGPYVNLFVAIDKLAEDALKAAYSDSDYGSLRLKGQNALIEHTSINPNASPHVGRARNGIIGDSIARLLRFHGYKTEVHYFVNDIGKQIAILVYGCKGKVPEFEELLDIYVDINKKMETEPEIEKEALSLLNRLEAGDKDVRKAFRRVVEVCVKGHERIFSGLGIKYDSFDYESDFIWNKEDEKVLGMLKNTGKLFTDEEGRMALDLSGFNLPMKNPVLPLTRADKTSLYNLRDIAYNLYKLSRAEKNIVVLGEDHKLYYQQIKAALSLLGKTAPKEIHCSFILLAGKGKMSTRKGNIVLLSDFMREALEKAKQEILKRDPEAKEVEKTASVIGYGALKYHIIKVSPEKNVIFDWDQALSFDGESAPYIQYSYARITSIIKKHKGKVGKGADFSVLKEKEEAELIKAISEFPDAAQKALNELKPHLLAVYAYSLADKFSKFYHLHKVLDAEESVKQARLMLCAAAGKIISKSLYLLGIDTVDRM